MLYRPFLHYVSEKGCAGRTIDERSYACAAACVSVSRNIVHITAEMKKRGLLVGAYWFTVSTLLRFRTAALEPRYRGFTKLILTFTDVHYVLCNFVPCILRSREP